MFRLTILIRIVLLAAYVLTTSDMLVNLHYCLGRVKAVNLAVHGDGHCSCPIEAAEKDCCKSEQQLITAQSEHLQQKKATSQVLVAEMTLMPGFATTIFSNNEPGFDKVSVPRGPPKVPLFVQQQVFRL